MEGCLKVDRTTAALMHSISRLLEACLHLELSIEQPPTPFNNIPDRITKPATHHWFLSCSPYRRIVHQRQRSMAEMFPTHEVSMIPDIWTDGGMC